MEGLDLGGFLFGNINNAGALEDDSLDDELLTALSSVTKRVGGSSSNANESGLALDFSFVGISKEDIILTSNLKGESMELVSKTSETIASSSSKTVDFSNIDELASESEETEATGEAAGEDKDYQTNVSTQTAKTIKRDKIVKKKKLVNLEVSRPSVKYKSGGSLRYTNFFNARPAYGEGRYRIRKLRVKKRKILARPILYQQDQSDLFQRSLSSSSSLAKKVGYLEQIVNSLNYSGKRKFSWRLKFIEDSFEHRKDDSHPLCISLPENNPIFVDDFKAAEISEWEANIVFDAPPQGTVVKSPLTPFFAGVVSLGPSAPPSRNNSYTGSISRSMSPVPHFTPGPPQMQTQMQNHQSLSNRSSVSAGSFGSRMPPLHSNNAPKSMAGRISNFEFASCKWEDQIIFDDTRIAEICFPPINLQLNLNDPFLIFENVDNATTTSFNERIVKTHKLIHKKLKKLRHGTTTATTSNGKALVIHKYAKPIGDRFNISNDKFYEVHPKENSSSANNAKQGGSSRRLMVSSRVGVHHSIPALKLAMPFYRTFWNKNELRSWHRPKFDTLPIKGKPLSVSLGGGTKKEGNSKKSFTGLINTSKKLSLRDSGSEYVMLEYSEEFPLLMMNVGMATFLPHFYRKLQVKDSVVPECEFGVPRILEPNESSPFWFFGDIRPGETVPAIQNNLFRAPLFVHSGESNDFLLLKFNFKGRSDSQFYLKELPKQVCTVGQVFPTMEVFGPHSRKHNTFCRNRIQTFAYRLFRKDSQSGLFENARPRLKISRIMAAFPQFSEGSLRKWLKEYADSVRSGQDSGSWRMRGDAPNLNEDDLRGLVTPEMICQYESMLASQQRLNDAGLLDAPEFEGADEEEDTGDNENGELKQASWNLSTNFINATMNKCALQLAGSGDPSGCGEAFSFVKAPQKTAMIAKLASIPENSITDSASASGSKGSKTMNTEQASYRQEIVKIWDAQRLSLNRATVPIGEEEVTSHPFSMFEEESANKEEQDDETASRSSAGKSGATKKLVIKRESRNPETGEVTEDVEVIEDPRLITAYINQRRSWERKRRRRQIAAAASAARAKKARTESLSDISIPPPKPRQPSTTNTNPKMKKEVSVKCGTCGLVGHMRTNRVCPKYAEYEQALKMSNNEEGSKGTNIGEEMIKPKISFNKSYLDAPASMPPLPSIKLKLTTAPKANIEKPKMVQKKSGVDINTLEGEKRKSYEILCEKFMQIVNEIMAIPESWPFHKPVSKTDYPHYYKMVLRPLDFSTIRSRIKRHLYSRRETLLADIALVRDNCVQFNAADHPFSQTADRLNEVAREKIMNDETLLELENSIFGSKETLVTVEPVVVQENNNNNDDEEEEETVEVVVDDS